MKLDISDIEHIAGLARLELSENEKRMYAQQLSVVLDYVDILNEVETDGIAETCQVTGLEDIVRKDEVVSCDSAVRARILEQFPDAHGGLLKVRAVFDERS